MEVTGVLLLKEVRERLGLYAYNIDATKVRHRILLLLCIERSGKGKGDEDIS
jgi:hypothetical protein